MPVECIAYTENDLSPTRTLLWQPFSWARTITLFVSIFGIVASVFAEAIIVKGAAIPELVGKKIASIRMCTREGNPVPFQIDEITGNGEYICDSGESPNADSSNGILDKTDEIVFMREDAPIYPSPGNSITEVLGKTNPTRYPIVLQKGTDFRVLYMTHEISEKPSPHNYINYDHNKRTLSTSRYYAVFAHNRFHFVRAGIKSPQEKQYHHLTRELRVEISLKALWGLLPIHYSEDNLICYVKRYKIGPIRCIRAGNFHLRLGLGLKGSHAFVHQFCYPDMVYVPVSIHIPIKFRRFFSEAWMEMTPVIDSTGASFNFVIPQCEINESLLKSPLKDTLIPCLPKGKLFTVQDNNSGYGWLLTTNIPDSSIAQSRFLLRRVLKSRGIAACGFRLELRDIERGRYLISNRVFFPPDDRSNISSACTEVLRPCTVYTNAGRFVNSFDNP